MSIVSSRTIPEELKTILVQVTDYREKNLQGIIYNAFFGREIYFDNLTQFLLYMEKLMDETNCPEASTRARSFHDISHKDSHSSRSQESRLYRPADKIIASFRVKVLFRQGASWQGKLDWQEGQQEVSFRSVLELIKLIDSALTIPEKEESVTEGTMAHIG